MPGSVEFSKMIYDQQIPQALVSASPRPLVDAVITKLPKNYFRETVASGDIARTKPFPDPYLHAAKLLGVDIKNCLIFEDSPTGIAAATASGAFVVAIPHFIEIAETARLKVSKSFLDIRGIDLEQWWELNEHELGKLS
jgi:beta-phosphoglucomutase-like phosphatase (HAD superfamily)